MNEPQQHLVDALDRLDTIQKELAFMPDRVPKDILRKWLTGTRAIAQGALMAESEIVKLNHEIETLYKSIADKRAESFKAGYDLRKSEETNAE